MRRSTRLARLLTACALAAASLGAPAQPATPAERGAYLARIGNCAGCHSAPGGADYAGGLHLTSDYGTFITPNITPDRATGIGGWSKDDFYAALHRGRRADGSPLYPACPYPYFTHMPRSDVDALYAYLRGVAAVKQRHDAHDLGFPYRYRWLLSLWQRLYFEPGALAPKPQQSATWNRGRYLVEGPGHCNACHRGRTRLGARLSDDDAPGAIVHGWYAPPLADPDQAGLQRFTLDDAARFLRAGSSERAAMMGPMADVVFESLQHLSDADALAMASYLKSLPAQAVAAPERRPRVSAAGRRRAMQRGGELYAESCADCHGDRGEGGHGAPALAGNRIVTMDSPINAARMIRRGGFAAATRLNPRPYGMPPFHDFSDRQLAAVLTYIRGSWGNDAPPVAAHDLPR